MILICAKHLGKSKEAESKRINKELANIRSKFKGIYFLHFSILALYMLVYQRIFSNFYKIKLFLL